MVLAGQGDAHGFEDSQEFLIFDQIAPLGELVDDCLELRKSDFNLVFEALGHG